MSAPTNQAATRQPKRRPADPAGAALPCPDGERLLDQLREAEQTARRLYKAVRRHACRPGRSGYCDDCALEYVLLETIVGTLRLGNTVEAYLLPSRQRQLRQPR